MVEAEIFIANLLRVMQEQGLSEAELSQKAGLNRRAVTDLREKRVSSPKLSTVFALSRALNVDPGEMMGLGPRPQMHLDLLQFLADCDEDEQERILQALKALRGVPAV